MSFPRKAQNPEKAAVLKIIMVVFWFSCSIKNLTTLEPFAKSWIPAYAGMTTNVVK
jgi:hypothetical protein